MQSKAILALAAMVGAGFILWAALVFAGKADAQQFVNVLQQAVIAGGSAFLALLDPKN